MGKIRIQQDNLCRLRSRFTARCHCYTAIRIFHGKNIIDTVTRHCNCVFIFLECLHQLLFLLWCYPAKNRILSDRFFNFKL